MGHHNFLPPCRISIMPTLPCHAGIISYFFQTKMSGSVHIKFRNKSEYSMTYMLNPTLVKLKKVWLITTLNELKMNSTWWRVHKRHLLYLLFFGSISISIFLFKIFFKENILSCDDLPSLWVASTQFIFFCPFKKDYIQIFVWKNNN